MRRPRLKLWHKIFVCSFLMVLISHLLTFSWYLTTYERDQRVDNLVRYLSVVSDKLKMASDEELVKFIDGYRIDDRRVWLEDPEGRVLIGEPWPGMSLSERGAGRVKKRYDSASGTVLLLRQKEPSLLAMFPVASRGRKVVLCFNWQCGRLISFVGIFVQSALGLICLSVFLSFWSAKKISRPLSTLRDQVVKIARGDLTVRLQETGEEEVADLSRAVNELTENLSLHIDSMKQLMANMSHEMRSTVTNISVSLEISEEAAAAMLASLPETRHKERFVRNLGQAKAELDLLGNMISSGLLGGKLDLRHEELELDPLDFSSLCRQVLNRHKPRALRERLKLICRAEPGVWLMGDEVLLDRLLVNILDNALKYTSPGGKIELRLQAEGEFVILACHNTHPPLTEEQLKKLCLPYFRVEQSHIQGSGLGLYLVERIAALHGGGLTAQNLADGLLFTIHLPLPDEAARRTV
ncbi:MAG: HAMP domain-containing histidine kinase [Deltaproteobacteria bacterium]|nr:HAMP domain-containing histidine kinase [Deltaproteobacteria bacterium]